jgi:hypothetical protein
MSKDPAAVELGRKGGLAKVPKGTAALSPKERKARAMVEARWSKSTKKERTEAARAAANARWKGKKQKAGG